MAIPNEEVVRRAVSGLGAGDLDAFLDALSDEAVMVVPGRGPYAGEHRGKDRVADVLRRQTKALGGRSPEVEVHDLLAGEGHVVVLQSARFEGDGRTLEDKGILVFHVRDGAIADIWVHSQDQYANDEFWSAIG